MQPGQSIPTHPYSPSALEVDELIAQAREPMAQPLESLGLTELRNLKDQLERLKEHGVMEVNMYKSQAAILMSPNHYQLMLAMTDKMSELSQRLKEYELSEASSSFDQLFATYTSKQSTDAADALFSASADDLTKAFRPGATEKK